MIRTASLRLVFGLGAASLAACGSAEQSPTDGMTGPNDASAVSQPAETGDKGVVKLPPQEFVDRAAASDLFEIEAARIAMDKAQSDDVRKFASMMLHDHDQAQAQLKTAVAAADMRLHYAPKLSTDQESQLEALREADGDFDAVYLRGQRAAHEEALALLHGYAQVGEAQPLRKHAQAASQTVTMHLNQVQSVAPAEGETR